MAGPPERAYGHIVRVLICDDEPDIRLLYRGAFERAGVDVDEASDGDEALEVADEHTPDLIVLDLFMPRRDGLSVLPEMHRRFPGARIVIVSATAAVEVFDRGRALGAAACYEKMGFLNRIPQVIDRYGSVA